MSVIDTLITDRAQADVDAVKRMRLCLVRYGLKYVTEEYMAGMRGAYNYTDLNRVGNAVLYLKDRFQNLPDEIQAYCEEIGAPYNPSMFPLPYDPDNIPVNPKTDWKYEDIPTQVSMREYLNNIATLRDYVTMPKDAPELPENMNKLDYTIANNIEKVIIVIDSALTELRNKCYNIADRCRETIYSGEIYSGEGE